MIIRGARPLEIPTRPADGLPPLMLGNIRLREVREGDACDLADLFADAQVADQLSLVPTSAEDFIDWIQLSSARRSEGRAACYIVQLGPAMSGLFIASRPTAVAPTAEAGFVLAPHLWGTGVFTTASRLMISSLFDRWDLTGLTVRTLARNHRGMGAMRKLGAKIIDRTMRGTEPELVWMIARESWPGSPA